MNNVTDFLFETVLDMQPLPTRTDTKAAAPALRRALLTSVGEAAHAVCRRTLVLASDWLGVTPPIAHWAIGAPEAAGSPAEMEEAAPAAALDAIALRKVADELRRAGYELQNTEELAVWIVVGDEHGALPDPAGIQALADTLRRLAWNRMRAQTATRLMAMVEPVDADALVVWRRQISKCAPSIYLSSPINLRHMRLDAHDHAEQTAVALAAFLCGGFPSYAQPGSQEQLAIGAAAWSAPVATVQRGLALHSVIHLVAGVRAQLEQRTQNAATQGASEGGLARIASLDQCDVDLAAAVSPSMPAVRWRDLHIGWDELSRLRSVIPARLERREARLEQAARQQRLDWLDQRMEAWAYLLLELDQLQCPAGEGAPPLHQYALALTALQSRFAADLDMLAAAFERNEQRMQSAAGQVDSAWEKVELLCSQLPQMTTRGVLFAALLPWMWPIWPYAFRVMLPQEGQRLLDSLAHRDKVRWHEANWHILRQMTLAMRQDVNQRLHALDQLVACCDALHVRLVAELEALSLPAPWTHATLRTLWESAQSNLPALIAFPAAERPLDWLSETIDGCSERLLAYFTTIASFVARWSVLDFLAQPFRNSESSDADALHQQQTAEFASLESLPSTCIAWLTNLAESALPLWPDPAVTPITGAVGWCLLPQPMAGMADSGYGPEAIRHWCEDVVNLAPATLAGRTLAILRWTPVGASEEAARTVCVDEEDAL